MDYNIREIMLNMKGYSFPYFFITICNLGVFDILYETKMTISELAVILNIPQGLLIRLLRPLKAIKLIDFDDEVLAISLTDYGKIFSSKSDTNFLSRIKFHEKEGLIFWKSFEDKIQAVRSKNFERNNRFFEFSEDLEKTKLFINMMDSVSTGIDISEIILKRIEVKNKHFVDIGGGVGTLTLKILSNIPQLTATVYDLPHLENHTNLKIKEHGFENKCRFVSGDFFNTIPLGDFYLLSRVLHDWNDDECNLILSNIQSKMEHGQKLFILERILPNGNEGKLEDYMRDLNVYCMCGGQERTIKEYDMLIKNNGLNILDVYDIDASSSLKCIEVCGV